MKKKLVVLMFGLIFILAGCGGKSEKTTSNNKENSVSSGSTTLESTNVSKKEVEGEFVATANDAYFDGTILKGNSYSVKITSHRVIQPGEEGNEYSDKPVIAFWYDTLVSPNYDDSTPINASSAWIFNFEAIQDNDPNMVNALNVASLPDHSYLDTQTADIKPGGTVPSAIAYELSDLKTPVTLIAKSFDEVFGKKDFTVE